MKFDLEGLPLLYFCGLFIICAIEYLGERKKNALFILIGGLLLFGILAGLVDSLESKESDTEIRHGFPKLKRK